MILNILENNTRHQKKHAEKLNLWIASLKEQVDTLELVHTTQFLNLHQTIVLFFF